MSARVFAGIAVAALVPLCQCSLFFDLGGLDDGGPGAGALDAAAETLGDAGDRDGANDGTGMENGADARGLDAKASGEGGGGDLDATSDAASFEAAEPGTVDGPADSGTDAAAADAAGTDAATDAGRADAPADGGGVAVGLVAFYPFAEGSGATSADASGNNHTASMQGATFAPGIKDSAATMNGSAQYVSLPAGIVSGLTAFSVSTWVNLNTALTHTHIFDFGTGTNTYMFLTPRSGSNMLQFAITTTGGGGEQVLNAPALGTGGWQHLCVTLAGTTGTLYVNGMPVAQNAAMTLNPASLGVTPQNWLGRSQFGADPYLNGKVDEFRIYSRALSATEVQQLFQQQL